jgi:tetratricopeptide (TPR) repeat protein
VFDISELEKLRASGNYETAAQWGMKNGAYLEAAKDFRKSGKEQDELNALKQYVQENSDLAVPWVWQRIAELGEGLGDLQSAANAWLMLDRPEDAGDAYLKLANSLRQGMKTKWTVFPLRSGIGFQSFYRRQQRLIKKQVGSKMKNAAATRFGGFNNYQKSSFWTGGRARVSVKWSGICSR